jgi:type II secretory pathway pseudopilin PulG
MGMAQNSMLKQLGMQSLKKSQAGFQLSSFLIGMLVAVIMIAILGVGGLYFFAISYDDDYMITEEPEWAVDSLNRAQQSYYLKKGNFTSNFNDLQGYPAPGQGHLKSSKYFVYSTQVLPNLSQSISNSLETVFSYGVPRQVTITYRNGVPLSLHSVVGAVFLVTPPQGTKKGDRDERIMVSILCQTSEPSNTQPPVPKLENGLPVCGSGTKSIAP